MQQAKISTQKWATFSGASRYSGLSEGTLQNGAKAGAIRTALVKVRPDAKRGRRLVDLRSLDAWIEAGVGVAADLPHLADACAKSHESRRANRATT